MCFVVVVDCCGVDHINFVCSFSSEGSHHLGLNTLMKERVKTTFLVF